MAPQTRFSNLTIRPGDVALVTGASRGIGRGVAVRLAKEGCKLALLATSEEALRETRQQCLAVAGKLLTERQVITIVADVTNDDAVRTAVERCVRELGDLTIVINSAGINRRRTSLDADPKVWARLLDINLKGSMATTAYALAHMRKSCYGAKRGVIIFMGSVASRTRGSPGLASYAASKHGLLAFSNSVMFDILEGGLNIKTCTINANLVNTELGVKPRAGKGEVVSAELMIQVEDVAQTVMFIIGSSDTVIPSAIDLDNVRKFSHYVRTRSNI